MMRLFRVGPRAAVLFFPLTTASLALAAHAADDTVPLTNWTAPPYWTAPAEPRARSLESKRPESLGSAVLEFHAVFPCRIADTRGNGFTGAYGPPSLMAGTVRTFLVTSPNTSCGIPSTAAAVSFNFAAVLPSANGNLVAYPSGGSAPTVSSLNWTPSEIAISNAGVIPLGTGGGMSVLVNGPGGSTTDLVIDVNGYYEADPLVSSLNGLSGDVTLGHDADVTVGVAGQAITVGTDATSAATPSTLVRRDASGNFSAGTITGNVAGAASANVLKAGDTMTGNLVMNGGDIDLGASGKIVRGPDLYLHSPVAPNNTFLGSNAGNTTLTGIRNTGIGRFALSSPTTGVENTAVGVIAGGSITSGSDNTAVGVAAGSGIVTGVENTTVGDYAGSNINIGSWNVAVGGQAGMNIFGSVHNVVVGYGAMSIASGLVGSNNVAVGDSACKACGASNNTAVGDHALANNNNGANNIAIGKDAGSAITTGFNNIDIGNAGAVESATIRIGNTQNATFVAGILGATAPSGVPVLVGTGGQLGTTTSSARFKDDVRDMGAESDLLHALRPVVFRYKPEIDPAGLQEFGLIAEEVERVRPDLVVCGEDGQASAIRYQELVPMLVNEVQKDRRELERSQAEIRELKARLERIESAFAAAGR
jgi:hypothetical protein